MDHRRERNAGGEESLIQTEGISRRAMVAGTVATAVLVVVSPISNFAYAEAAETKSPLQGDQDMVAFLLLSEALTGVNRQTLAPEFGADASDILNSDPGVDPINIKDEYFEWIKRHEPDSFGELLRIAKDNRQSPGDIIAKVNGSNDPVKFLARSLVLLWYLGSWYKPADLKNKGASPDHRAGVPSVVVSSNAYTQGLVWQIVGAHPMGYSNLQFGHWSRDPRDPNNKVGLFNPAKP